MNGARGGALPAALALMLALHLVAAQAALTAVTARLAAARTAAAEEAARAAETASLVATGTTASALISALARGEALALPDLPAFLPPGAWAEVRPRDDGEADGDPRADANGRLLLVALGRSGAPALGAPAERLVVHEALVGALTPLPAALLDCALVAGICGGRDGCRVPAARLDGGAPAPALAVPATRMTEMERRLLTLARENLRRAAAACSGGICPSRDDDLLRAAATGLIRAVDDPAGDASALSQDQVALLVENLLPLVGDESGPGGVTWWDGGQRDVPEVGALVQVLMGLTREAGHLPDLGGHPLPASLRGASPWSGDEGLCARLPALVAAARRRSAPLAEGTAAPAAASGIVLLAGERILGPGEVLSGRGLLLVEGRLEVPAGAAVRWRGILALLARGEVAGAGEVEVEGGVVVLGAGPEGGPSLDLMTTPWRVTASPAEATRAWEGAGIVLLSRWEASPGE